MSNIVLVGFMGTGKSVVGKTLAAKLDREFLELDEIIEQREGIAIREIFETKGESYFRDVEKQVVKEISEKTGIIISTGGGAVVDEENMRNLKKNGIIICLEASPGIILKRIKGLATRPLLNISDPKEKIKELLKKRETCYRKADFCINTDPLTVEEVVNNIIKLVP